ncbi:MAG: HlyD family efflux transporter periplasmic adaptor subunit, partial [Pseudomonadales bacterium]|nr:HlyD family efflux transporter periplasmic adaptor subunit [Pseudomonadales bacterium]
QEIFLRTDELYQAALNRGDSRDVLEPLILERDTQRRLFEISEWQFRSAQQGIIQVGGGGLREQIRSIEVDIDFLERQLAQARADEAKNRIIATQPGIVVIRNFDVGGIVSVGMVVAEISNDNDRQAVFWVPEEFLDQIEFGAKLPVSNRPQNRNDKVQTIEAPINFIDFSAQFTPREAASATNQNRLSFQVKLELPDEVEWRVAQRVNLTLSRN